MGWRNCPGQRRFPGLMVPCGHRQRPHCSQHRPRPFCTKHVGCFSGRSKPRRSLMAPARASLRSVFVALAALLLTVTPAPAQQPKLEMHRVGVSSDDGSASQLAACSKGSCSSNLPTPFNEFTPRAATGEASHVIGGKSAEGIKYPATELPITAKTPGDLQAITKS